MNFTAGTVETKLDTLPSFNIQVEDISKGGQFSEYSRFSVKIQLKRKVVYFLYQASEQKFICDCLHSI